MVARTLSRPGVVDPKCVEVANVQMNERRVWIVADPDVVEDAAEISDRLVLHSPNRKIDGPARVMIRAAGVPLARMGPKPADDHDVPAPKMIAQNAEERHQTG